MARFIGFLLVMALALFMPSTSIVSEPPVAADLDRECINGPYAPTYRIGGNGELFCSKRVLELSTDSVTVTIGKTGGDFFCESRINSGGSHDIINGLEIFIRDDWGIVGIQFTYSSGDQIKYGGITETSESIRLDDDEQVTSLYMWGNGNGRHLGYIYMSTSKGQILKGGKDVSS